ncbi:MAG: twin-arginine translocation signal domain-containing protein, partial [Sedimentisphaerales bacterium]|nr:twin-arginine translocation signal domain-containing protein [Sedimentisphaerales bacterium]
MSTLNRRNFMKGSLISAAGISMAAKMVQTTWAQVPGANDDIRLAVVGVRGQGAFHVRTFRQIPGVRVVALCDPDQDIL